MLRCIDFFQLKRVFAMQGPYLMEKIDKEQTEGRKYSYGTKLFSRVRKYDFL